ncbi:cytomegalovirus gH-receptor family protein [Blastomyces dermatitidis ER-3]|uniref:Cytomegalovirus gH-receptor family protein n=2 Tax=Ajellomyces dermatitidis TaxID=5039 RepID=F2TB30_AJEDA|nr:cytomegalovirus gH-receptor family protein [Blastomyces dermatitidis ER-3]EEQ83634.2 cytomegalovirus gH-receptor family protein [Blastomyces dermatitidis ER-3]EGE80443.2 cytomegalovirus gH-receptor family protein [Blastomyces dermatitidis ATCC 18188]EQL31082.1 hypothetical protein BDFG_06552 [Blastomyces dermatitidis ATCC 26199]
MMDDILGGTAASATAVSGGSSEIRTNGKMGSGSLSEDDKRSYVAGARKGSDADIGLGVKGPFKGSNFGAINGHISPQPEVLHKEHLGMPKSRNPETSTLSKHDGANVVRFHTPDEAMEGQRGHKPHFAPTSTETRLGLANTVKKADGGTATVASPASGDRPVHQAVQPADVGTPSSSQRPLKPINTNPQSPSSHDREKDKVLKLSPAKIHELTSSPESLTLHSIPLEPDKRQPNLRAPIPSDSPSNGTILDTSMGPRAVDGSLKRTKSPRRKLSAGKNVHVEDAPDFLTSGHQTIRPFSPRQKSHSARAVSTTDTLQKRRSSASGDRVADSWPRPNRVDTSRSRPNSSSAPDLLPSPAPQSIPLPPFSIPTYLQLELASERPSPLYIHRSSTNDFPYESSRAKLERLQNFFLLPPALEQVLFFGALACIDAWLYYFTILPLRFLKSIFLLLRSWAINVGAEAQFISRFIFTGLGRVWRRRQQGCPAARKNGHDQKHNDSPAHSRPRFSSNVSTDQESPFLDHDVKNRPSEKNDPRNRVPSSRRHRRTRSIPSTLLPNDKADILKGFLMICTCLILMYFDASRVYHWIRGQAAIKLYVIYNVLEVGDRLLSAIGQDVLECLFSREALERKPDGRSKILRPFWLFIIALIYTVIHSVSLFYQVITLNVAVNSYSNALITLLLSNQFVEIKSTVFKKFEKENLFQLTCADVVERFQLWLMLTIIASRNIVETGIFSFGSGLSLFAGSKPTPSANATSFATPPRTASSILPQAFTILPSSLLSSLSKVNSFLPTIGHLLGPFLVVLGSEMIVDWLKHAYINKFNNIRPALYGRFLDILAKDYYTNAFADQNLNRRLGLPVIPLACLFFRVSIQTYQMFLTSWLPQTPSLVTQSNTTSLTSIHDRYSPSPSPSPSFILPLHPLDPSFLTKLSSLFQTMIAHATPSPAAFIPIFTTILVLLLYLTLLFIKLILGIILLSYSRARYKKMKSLERVTITNASSSKPTATPSTMATTTAETTPPPPPPPSQFPNPQPTTATTNPDIVEGARRVGGWGAVEVGEDRRRWIYADDPEGARRLKEREERDRVVKPSAGGDGIEGVMRYEMAAKRIW